MSGVPTGMTPATTATLPNETPKGLPALDGEPREVALGGTTLRFPALRRDRASRLSSNTLITVSELRDPWRGPLSGVPKTLSNRRLQVKQNQTSRSTDFGFRKQLSLLQNQTNVKSLSFGGMGFRLLILPRVLNCRKTIPYRKSHAMLPFLPTLSRAT
jgi:hypothetical protein